MTRLVPDRKCSDQYTSFLNDVWTTVLMRVHGKWLIRWKSRESSLRNKKKDKIVTYGSGKITESVRTKKGGINKFTHHLAR